MDEAKYLELFPATTSIVNHSDESFINYTQLWLDSRSITEGTRNNYRSLLNTYWMPHLAATSVRNITVAQLRKIVASTQWVSNSSKRAAIHKLRTVLKSVVNEGFLTSNPADLLDMPKKDKKPIEPFTQEEANQIIEHLYKTTHWPSLIYAAFFEFVFYSGLRLGEAAALRWDAVDMVKRTAHVSRTVALGEVVDRTKTNTDRVVLLNDRALHALTVAQGYIERRLKGQGRIKEFPYCFPPSKGQQYVKQTSDLHHQWRPTLKELGIRYHPPYNARHTYATFCLMANMNTAFIAKQLGHSVQMLLTTYAKWIDSDNDWAEMGKLNIGP